MAHKAEFKTSLLRMFRARIPFIAIRSIERTRVLEVIQQLAEEINVPIYVHSLSHGMVDIKTKKLKKLWSKLQTAKSSQLIKRLNKNPN